MSAVRMSLPVVALAAASPGGAQSAAARDVPPASPDSVLESLVARALAVHPSVLAAAARVEAARARVVPAGTWMDPMLMAGVQNFPVGEPGFGDFMTMKMLGVAQTVPYPGKTRLRRTAAELELAAAEARLRAARLEAEQRVRDPFYELAYLDRAIEIVGRNQRLLQDFVRVSEVRYSVGSGGQQDVLKAQVEVARLAEEAASLAEHRRIAQARLNEAVDRYSETPVPEAAVPDRIARAAAFDAALGVKNTSTNLTMGLFWIRPDTFLSLDSRSRAYFDEKVAATQSAAAYKAAIARAAARPGMGDRRPRRPGEAAGDRAGEAHRRVFAHPRWRLGAGRL